MTRYQLAERKVDDYITYVLTDAEYPAEAHLVPGFGNNLFRFSVNNQEVFVSPEKISMIRDASARFGNPILFPPNKIRHGSFSFNGKKYQLGLNKGEHHSHGELRVRAWNVIDRGAKADRGAFVVSEFDFADHPDLLEAFQARLVFRFTYVLQDGVLRLEGEVKNESEVAAPFMLGFHPYFHVKQGHEQQTIMQVSSKLEWPVNEEGFVDGSPTSTDLCQQLTKGLAYPDMPKGRDHAFVTVEDGTTSCELIDQQESHKIVYEFGDQFPFMLVFQPSWNNSVSLEPYTAVTDAFNLDVAAEQTGARGLEPGEQFVFTHTFRVEKL
ncbi:aldose 1-epimerase [Brevibacillus laterosporus]|uniref:aldose 1-epimerase n=1 Tax=Brevibacillus laterosporus TaxID=1465 RepID=UPI0003B19886|nr:aldose 1-epimerase [Brevibacillus laterosporus]ERM19037.1 aldose 1-epimerase [Brevibacillus laterosporus PE36]